MHETNPNHFTDVQNSLLDQTKIIYILFDLEHNIKFINPAFEFHTGYKIDEINIESLISIVHPEDRELVNLKYFRSIKEETYTTHEIRFVSKSGNICWFIANWQPFYDKNHNCDGVFVTLVDITARKNHEGKLQKTKDNFISLFDSNIVGVTLSDLHGNLIVANDALLNILGYTRAEFNLGRIRWTEITPPEYQAQDKVIVQEIMDKGKTEPFEKEYIRKDGTRVPVLVGLVRLRGNLEQTICLVIDLSKQKELEQKLNYQATHDSLTGLPNRRHFFDILKKALTSTEFQSDNKLVQGLMFIDVDDFKHINDSYGHDIGDEALIVLAKKLQSHTRQSDTVARLGGDEFVIFFQNITQSELIEITQRIYDDLKPVQRIGDFDVKLSISVGIIYNLDKYSRPDHVLKYADEAMYKAKTSGKGRYYIL